MSYPKERSASRENILAVGGLESAGGNKGKEMPTDRIVLFLKSISSSGNFHSAVQFDVLVCSHFQVTLVKCQKLFKHCKQQELLLFNHQKSVDCTLW